MNSALPWIVANGITSSIVALVFGYLAKKHDRLHLRLWAWGWAGFAVIEVVAGVDTLVGPSTAGILFSAVLGSAIAILFYRGTMAFLGRPPTRTIWFVTGIAALAVIGMWVALQSELAVFPLLGLMAGAFFISGARLVQVRPRSAGSLLSGGALIADSLHILDFPLLSGVESALAWGYLVGIVLEVVICIGLLMLHFEATQRDLARMQADLDEGKRLETIGRLAAGVAHDFNNLLTAILGNVDLVAAGRDDAHLKSIKTAAEQASRLTQQLLAYGRRSPVNQQRIDLVAVVNEAMATLNRLVPETVEVAFSSEPDSLSVIADRAQVEQLVSNLVTNAVDAMPDGGRLGISLGVDGGYFLISVSDSGSGIPDDIRDKIFEPFVTTKQLGRGTGLGLSTVYGIVKQQGGRIDVRSDAGGTRVEVRLPFSSAEPAPEARPVIRSVEAWRILVAEDDETVRQTTCMILRREGFEVVDVADGQAALDLVRADPAVFDAVVSDVVMPCLGGLELARALLQEAPALRILLVSGYPGTCEEMAAEFGTGVHFLAKPFTRVQLLDAVAALREQVRGPTAPAKEAG